MSNLEHYIEKTKKYIEENNFTETEIIRYVYLDLGKRFSFNLEFNFGKSKEKVQIYRKNNRNIDELNECMENDTIICRSVAYILEYVLSKLGIKIISSELDDNKLYPHVHNIVDTSDFGRYVIDLQRDLGYIQSHSRTRFFGLSIMEWEEKSIITRFSLEQIDKKLGYIDKTNYYSDDYLYLLKSDIGFFEEVDEKAKFILENIDICDNPNMRYFERKNFHYDILKELFTIHELTKIHQVDFYQEIGDKKDYKNCIVVDKKGGVDIYIYSVEDSGYKSISLEDFSEMADSGLLYPKQCPKLNEILKDFRNTQER